MDDSRIKLATEAAIQAARATRELARLNGLAGADLDGEWIQGVSYWRGYMTIIDLKTASSSLPRAS